MGVRRTESIEVFLIYIQILKATPSRGLVSGDLLFVRLVTRQCTLGMELCAFTSGKGK